MARSLEKSNAHFRRAYQRVPLGVASNFRYWGEDRTIYVQRGKGARLWDIDGNSYIDYRMGYGPSILGYADERVSEAAREGIEIGGVFALSTERELEVAELISSMVPAAELVRFSVSGSEAVMAALRLARSYTGKDSMVLIEGGYHGVFTEGLWYSDVQGWDGTTAEPPLVAWSRGVPDLLKQLVHVVPLNDANRVESLFQRHGDRIAAFLVEPIMGNCCSLAANPKYLHDVRFLCDKYGVVLIIDEVKTGFRVARGGVQELTGVRADICTFAKAMANGYPISVVAGREDIMRQVENGVAHGGTYTAHSVSLAAAACTLRILRDTPALEKIAAYGTRLREGIGRVLSRRGIAHCFTGHPSMSGLFFSSRVPSNYRDWKDSDYTFYSNLAPRLHDLGILVEPDSREPWFVSEAHDDHCLAETLAKFEQAVVLTLDHLSQQNNEPAFS